VAYGGHVEVSRPTTAASLSDFRTDIMDCRKVSALVHHFRLLSTSHNNMDDHDQESQRASSASEPGGGGRPFLLLTSHAYSPPLQTPCDLQYDLRTTPNPPKDIRDSSRGKSRRVRDNMLTNEKFVSLLESAEVDVREGMEKEIWRRESMSNHEAASKQLPKQEMQDDKAQNEAKPKDTQRGRPIVTVEAFCSRGHHRSVAFIEELAARPWPREWNLEIQVVHRDLHTNGKRQDPARRAGKNGHKEPQSPNMDDGDE
jgi:hypothetical protein